jgi:hypothetical protein
MRAAWRLRVHGDLRVGEASQEPPFLLPTRLVVIFRPTLVAKRLENRLSMLLAGLVVIFWLA